jgi:hypothetical protein
MPERIEPLDAGACPGKILHVGPVRAAAPLAPASRPHKTR